MKYKRNTTIQKLWHKLFDTMVWLFFSVMIAAVFMVMLAMVLAVTQITQ